MDHSAKTKTIAMTTSERSHLLMVWLLWMLFAISACVVTGGEPGEYLAPEHLNGAGRHPLYNRNLPPGAIWPSQAAVSVQQAAYQPVAFSGPGGTEFSLPQQGAFSGAEPRLMAGLMVGAVYRFRITNIPLLEGAELYPTVELIGRTYPPAGLETLYPVPINVSENDLRDALDGKLVTRVIYLEDPQTATPLQQETTDSRPTDIPLHQDAMATADTLGRPIAIVRIGSVAPPRSPELMPQFFFGNPPWAPIFQPEGAQETAQETMQTASE